MYFVCVLTHERVRACEKKRERKSEIGKQVELYELASVGQKIPHIRAHHIDWVPHLHAGSGNEMVIQWK